MIRLPLPPGAQASIGAPYLTVDLTADDPGYEVGKLIYVGATGRYIVAKKGTLPNGLVRLILAKDKRSRAQRRKHK
jgi:hypothetical protein